MNYLSSQSGRWLAAAALAAGATGCLELSPKPAFEPMCFQTSDCDAAAGEICDDGVCWGDPPAARFAAILDPPADGDGATALVPTELPVLSIARDGAISGLAFEPQVTVRGRVLLDCAPGDPACDPDVSIAATIRVRRPSRIPGLPPYTRVVVARNGRGAGESGFELRLPATGPDDRPYEITILPDDGSLSDGDISGPVPSELAPPLRIESYVAAADASEVFLLGNPAEHRLVTGRVVDAARRGLPDMQVFALGRWEVDAAPERGSTTAITDQDGAFTLRVPIGMLNTFDFVAAARAGNAAPTLQISEVLVPDPSPGPGSDTPVDIGDLQMPSFLNPVGFTLPVQGVDTNGQVVPVAEAAVKLVTFFDTGDPRVTAFYTEKTHTDAQGAASVKLIPGSGGNRLYVLQVAPSPTAEHAAVYAQSVTVPPAGGGVLEAVNLRRRVPVVGTLVTDGGDPVEGATVTASASLEFRLGLDEARRRELEAFQFTTTTTAADGSFVLWVDDELLEAPVVYDMEIAPSQIVLTQWSVRSVAVGERGIAGSVDLGVVRLPPASYARGTIRGPDGSPVAGARLRLFELPDGPGACADLSLPGAGDDCVPPPLARGVRRSDDDGFVMVVMPDPS